MRYPSLKALLLMAATGFLLALVSVLALTVRHVRRERRGLNPPRVSGRPRHRIEPLP